MLFFNSGRSLSTSDLRSSSISLSLARGGLRFPVARSEVLQRLSYPFGAFRVGVGTRSPAAQTLDADPEEQLEDPEYEYRVAETGDYLRDHLPEDGVRTEQAGGCEHRHAEDSQGRRRASTTPDPRYPGRSCRSLSWYAPNPGQTNGKAAAETARSAFSDASPREPRSSRSAPPLTASTEGAEPGKTPHRHHATCRREPYMGVALSLYSRYCDLLTRRFTALGSPA